jgi:hypothetical protein
MHRTLGEETEQRQHPDIEVYREEIAENECKKKKRNKKKICQYLLRMKAFDSQSNVELPVQHIHI